MALMDQHWRRKMASTLVTMDVFQLAEIFEEFLADGEVVVARRAVRNLGQDEEESPNRIASKMFAQFVIDRSSSPRERSPLEDFFDLAYIMHCLDHGHPRRGLSEAWSVYCRLLGTYPDLFTDEINARIESYFSLWREEVENERIEGVIANAIESHQRERRKTSLSVISSPKLRTLVMERDGAKCKWCDETEGLALDHIMPVVAGGTDDIENLQILCGSCNSSKGDRVPSQGKEGA